MNAKETYKQKIETEVASVQAQLVELKAKAKADNLAADARIEYAKQVDKLEVDKLEDALVITKARLKELDEAGDDVWENLKDSMDSAWNTLSTAAGNLAAKFKS